MTNEHIFELVSLFIQVMLFPMLGYALNQFKKMRESVDVLNVQIAVVISRLDTHEHRISRIEDKV